MGLRGSLKGTTKVRLTDSDKEDIRRMTLDGKGTAEIAEWIGCSDATVRTYRNKMGLTCTFVPERFWTDEDTATLVDMVAEKKSSVEIAAVLGRTKEAINIRACKLRRSGRAAYRNIKCSHPGKRKMHENQLETVCHEMYVVDSVESLDMVIEIIHSRIDEEIVIAE